MGLDTKESLDVGIVEKFLDVCKLLEIPESEVWEKLEKMTKAEFRKRILDGISLIKKFENDLEEKRKRDEHDRRIRKIEGEVAMAQANLEQALRKRREIESKNF